MTSRELREKFLKFFEKNGHKIIPSASLVPSEEEQLEGKEKVLFTSAGMQPLIPFLTGQKEPPSKKLVNIQKCLRTDDIEEVGDEVHHTFFEMLGNWSIGDYWKEEAITLSFKFLTEELEIPLDKLAITIFAGDEDAPRDEESAKVWQGLGIPEDKIFYFGKSHNWWPTTRGEQDSGEYKNPLGPCGPDTEMFYWTGEGEPAGRPNEDSRWVEIWNDVFMQFNRKPDGTLEDLPQKNVDTGMGLERTLAVLNGFDDDYKTDIYRKIIEILERKLEIKYYSNKEITKSVRIIADHIKASVFLISEGVIPSNKLEGYIVRRLLRRAIFKAFSIKKDFDSKDFKSLVEVIFNIYPNYIKENQVAEIAKEISIEARKFRNTIERGIKEFEKYSSITGKIAFDLYQSYGFPLELTKELAQEKGLSIDLRGFMEEREKHREISKTVSSGMFKGGLADQSEIVTKYHTATHLLHQALRDVLGPEVFQKGSNLTSERLRFDFSFGRKMTPDEIKQVEDLVNKKIEEDLGVDRKILDIASAKVSGAIGLFNEKYGSKVSIYGIGPGYKSDPAVKDQRQRSGYYSLEFCGGPHVERTGVIGKVKIIKEEAVSSGIRRIKAEIVLR